MRKFDRKLLCLSLSIFAIMPQTLSKDFLIRCAEKFGTPVYVYHAERIKEQFERLQNAFSSCDTRFFYACKALTNINILRYIRSIGCNVDCSSINEVHLALKAGFTSENILYTSSNIAFEEIDTAAQLGVNINIDSLSFLYQYFGRLVSRIVIRSHFKAIRTSI